MSEHAISNGQGWLQTMREFERAFDALDSSEESATVNGEQFTDRDALLERVYESPLSVEVRSSWHVPGSESGKQAAEYRLLLTTGGPALQIVGELSGYGEPESAYLEWQDWGKPWTRLRLPEKDAATVQAFASHFYYGEG